MCVCLLVDLKEVLIVEHLLLALLLQHELLLVLVFKLLLCLPLSLLL
jgi:hypothetical protein